MQSGHEDCKRAPRSPNQTVEVKSIWILSGSIRRVGSGNGLHGTVIQFIENSQSDSRGARCMVCLATVTSQSQTRRALSAIPISFPLLSSRLLFPLFLSSSHFPPFTFLSEMNEKEPATAENKDSTKSKDAPKPPAPAVPVFRLWRFASKLDLLLILYVLRCSYFEPEVYFFNFYLLYPLLKL